MRFLIYFSILCIIPITYGQCTKETAGTYFKRSVYDFTIDLTQRISQDLDYHFIASTLSPWTLLATLSLGATSNSLYDLKKALRLHPHNCFNNKFFGMIQELASVDQGATLERSASIVIDQSLVVKNEFISRIKKANVSEIHIEDFSNFGVVAQNINNFVSYATHGNIDEIITPEELENVYLVLIDALYFKGTWTTQFSEADTEVSAFYESTGDRQIGDVELMFVLGSFKFSLIDNIQAQVLELPYGNERFTMLILLPYKEASVPNVIDNLKTISLSAILNILDSRGKENVNVQIPKFKMTSDLDNLKELLADMGLRSIFVPGSASFGDISDYSVYVSNFIQKATVEVNEEGTTASEVSVATLAARTMPPSFTANKPFVYLIVDRQTELPIFVGAYSKPSL